jgi:hypothetical protein
MEVKLAHASTTWPGKGIFLEAPSWENTNSNNSVEPLLNLVEYSGDRRLQTEAVLALARAAQNMEVAAQLCTPQVILLLQSLTEVICFTMTEPLSRLADCLAKLPQAAALSELKHLRSSLEKTSFA